MGESPPTERGIVRYVEKRATSDTSFIHLVGLLLKEQRRNRRRKQKNSFSSPKGTEMLFILSPPEIDRGEAEHDGKECETPMFIEENIMVPMRDGVRLATDVYRPAMVGQWPVLLSRVPYNKDLRFPVPQFREKRVFLELNLDVERAVQAGYVVVAQDTRGRYASEGEFIPLRHEETDGADTIA